MVDFAGLLSYISETSPWQSWWKKCPPVPPKKGFPKLILYTPRKKGTKICIPVSFLSTRFRKTKKNMGKKTTRQQKRGSCFFLKVFSLRAVEGMGFRHHHYIWGKQTCCIIIHLFLWCFFLGRALGGGTLRCPCFFVVGDMFCLWPCFAKFDICKVDYDNMVCLRNRAA